MVETAEECEKKGGIGKYAPDICNFCSDLKECKVAEKDHKKHLKEEKEKQELKKEMAFKRLGGRKPTKKDLACTYCGANAENCKCKNKPEDRFELRAGRGWNRKAKKK